MKRLPPVLTPASKPKDKYLRHVSPRHASRYRLSKLGDALSLTAQSLVVTRDRKLCYVKNAKAGCSTLTGIMYHYDNGTHSTDPHAEKNLQQGIRNWENNMAAVRGGITIFSFVRHPENGIRSAFMNFFVDGKNRRLFAHKDAVTSRGMYKKADLSYRFDIFLEYIRDSLDSNKDLTDIHWRHQVLNIGLNEFNLAFVGKLEDGIDSGLERVSEISGVSMPKSQGRKVNESSRASTFALTEVQRRKIQDLYAVDYEAFGY